MTTVQKLIHQGKPELAAQLEKLAGMNDFVFISDHNDDAYESGLAAWLQENCNYQNLKGGFTAKIKK